MNSTEAKKDKLRQRILAHPAAVGGQADESYWLDLLQFSLLVFPSGTETLVDIRADYLLQNTEKLSLCIVASLTDPLSFKTLQTICKKILFDSHNTLNVPPQSQRFITNWSLAVSSGKIKEPKVRGMSKYENKTRNAMIVATVNGISELGGKPPTSPTKSSACRAVSDRLYISYDAVRLVWEKNKYLIAKGRLLGILPTPKN